MKNIFSGIVLVLLSIVTYAFGAEYFDNDDYGQSAHDSADEVVLENGLIIKGEYQVEKVVDGDTVHLNDGIKVRLIGVDAPEKTGGLRDRECFGDEATQFVEEAISGKQVTLYGDSSQDSVDKYNRTLGYIFFEQGGDQINLGQYIIESGYANQYAYDGRYFFIDEYKAAQKEAASLGRGLWAPGACARAN